MAQQDDIIIIRTVENITTSILDYFYNIALITPISEDDLAENATFDTSGIMVFSSLSALAEIFSTSSKIYAIGRDVFTQKTNTGANQSNLRRFVVLKKEDTDDSYEDALTRLDYQNSYFILVNPTQDSDIISVDNWVEQYRKIQFAQTDTEAVKTSSTTDVASTLKEKSSQRTALYYHISPVDEESSSSLYESLDGGLSAILSSVPIGGKTASYKKPTGITVDTLTSTEEGYLASKNVNYYVAYIGGAGDYSTRYLTSDNGVVCSGDEIQKIISVDRTVLSLQASLMDALEQDIPYDDNGGTIVYSKINSVFAELKNEGILAEDSVDEESGEIDKSYTINVLPRATVKKEYPDYFAQKMFIVECTLNFAGSAKKVQITLAY